jgi:mersacidin/lichenicidin family type 2 lantibiotic
MEMKNSFVVRALKDKNFRAMLSQSQQATIGHPVGMSEIDESLLNVVAGAGAGNSNNGCSITYSGTPTFHCACQQ